MLGFEGQKDWRHEMFISSGDHWTSFLLLQRFSDDTKGKSFTKNTHKDTAMSRTHYQSYGGLKKYLLDMCPITWWCTVTGLLSSASYSSNGKQTASISPHADPSAYELVLKTE